MSNKKKESFQALSTKDLQKALLKHQGALKTARIDIYTNTETNTSLIKSEKKNIARILTAMNTKGEAND